MMRRKKVPKILVFSTLIIPSAVVGVIEPLKFLEGENLLFLRYKKTEDVTREDMKWSDMMIVVRGAELKEIYLVDQGKAMGKYIIYYMDDDLLHIDKNETYNQNYFSNVGIRSNIYMLLQKCHCLWTTSGRLAELYEKMFERVVTTDAPALLMSAPSQPKTGTCTHIGFTGGIDHRTHFESMLFEPFERLIKKYKNEICIEVVGISPYYLQCFPITFFPYIKDYDQYRVFMLNRVWDIGIAPLEHSDFNACKYFNKFLENGAIEAAGIYSQEKPFTDIIKNEVNGLLVKNKPELWYKAMVKLIEDPQLRKTIALNAYHQLRTDFSLEIVSMTIYENIIHQ